MKILAMLSILSLFLVSPVFADEEAYRIRVDGLSCPFCAYGIEKKLKALPGVTGVKVEMEQGLVILRVKPGTEVSDKALRKAVKDAGFTPREITHGGKTP